MSAYNPQNQTSQHIPPVPEKKSGCGCLTGCLIVIVIGLILAIAGTWYGFVKVRSFVSDTKAMDLPEMAVTDAEREDAREKMQTLSQAIKNDNAVEIVLTAQDLNALMQAEVNEQMNGTAVIGIRNDRLTADFSIPLDDLPGFKGRYANGSAELDVQVTNGVLEVHAHEVSFKGKRVPDRFMKDLRKKNLADRVYENPNAREILKHIHTLKIENGRLIVRTTGDD